MPTSDQELTKRERQRQRREQRREAERRARARARRNRALLTGLALVAGIVVITFLVVSAMRDRVPPPEGVETFPVASSDHTQGQVQYPQTPPVGGAHRPPPEWQNCGFYDQPVQNENAVHSLEHGAVWITHQPDLPTEQVDVLRSLTQSNSYVLTSPFPGLPSPVVASAWGKQLKLDSADDPRLQQFVRVFQQGRQTPEPGAPCSGGVGQPAGR